jgi:hypothetical protein
MANRCPQDWYQPKPFSNLGSGLPARMATGDDRSVHLEEAGFQMGDAWLESIGATVGRLPAAQCIS